MLKVSGLDGSPHTPGLLKASGVGFRASALHVPSYTKSP